VLTLCWRYEDQISPTTDPPPGAAAARAKPAAYDEADPKNKRPPFRLE